MNNMRTSFFCGFIALNYCLVFNLAAMENPQIFFINETGQPLNVIFDKGILPITLSTQLPEGVEIPPECRRHEQDPHPLITYLPDGQTGIVRIPDEIRRNFSYGLPLSSTLIRQLIYLGLIRDRTRMVQDFAYATKFHVKTPNELPADQRRQSEQVEIEHGADYRIHYDGPNLVVQRTSPAAP